jgi:hypothetical protein
MGVAKQIPQLQPKAKERKSKKKECGVWTQARVRGLAQTLTGIRGSTRTNAHVHTDVRGSARALAGVRGSARTRWRGN